MKKQKINKFVKKNLILLSVFFLIIGTAFGAFTSTIIITQSSTGIGSNASLVSFSGGVDAGYYVNNEENSAIIGNYFTGYYYDSLFGFFKLDWSTDWTENVRIMDSTSMCATGYGYKLGGKAYSEISGYIDFNYNLSTFVYYCLDDGKLHGTAYGKYIGYQNFDGISLTIVNNVVDLTENISTSLFSNDVSSINQPVNVELGGDIFGGNINHIDTTRETFFYIIK